MQPVTWLANEASSGGQGLTSVTWGLEPSADSSAGWPHCRSITGARRALCLCSNLGCVRLCLDVSTLRAYSKYIGRGHFMDEDQAVARPVCIVHEHGGLWDRNEDRIEEAGVCPPVHPLRPK